MAERRYKVAASERLRTLQRAAAAAEEAIRNDEAENGSSEPPPRPLEGPLSAEERDAREIGVPTWLQAQLREAARVLDVIIVPRPLRTNWDGLSPNASEDLLFKPDIVHVKTINEIDRKYLGAPAGVDGLAAWFMPQRPDNVLPEDRRTAWRRYFQRRDEYFEQAPRILEQLRPSDGATGQPLAKVMRVVEGGLVQLHDPRDGRWKYVRSDLDLFAVYNSDGGRIDDNRRAALYNFLRAMEIGVEHGALRDWGRDDPETFRQPENQRIYWDLLEAHMFDENNRVVAFFPDGTSRQVRGDDELSSPPSPSAASSWLRDVWVPNPTIEQVRTRLDEKVPVAPDHRHARRAAAELHVDGRAPRSFQQRSGSGGFADRSEITQPARFLLRPDAEGPVPSEQPEQDMYLRTMRLPSTTAQPRPEGPFSRAHDAEAKVLEEISASLAEASAGTVYLRASHAPCGSCVEAIFRFRAQHPGVTVILV